MDYNKLKDKINSSYGQIKIFFEKEGDSIEFSAGGFYQAVRNDSLKISMLEKISKKLDIPMSYWWSEESENEIDFKQSKSYQKGNKDLEKYNEILLRQIQLLEDRLEKYEDKKKEAI